LEYSKVVIVGLISPSRLYFIPYEEWYEPVLYVSSLKGILMAILIASSYSLFHISEELGPFSCQGSIIPLEEPDNNILVLQDAQGFDLGDPNLLQKYPKPKGLL
jgi:hypothetical protein